MGFWIATIDGATHSDVNPTSDNLIANPHNYLTASPYVFTARPILQKKLIEKRIQSYAMSLTSSSIQSHNFLPAFESRSFLVWPTLANATPTLQLSHLATSD